MVIDAYRYSLPSWGRALTIEVARGGNIFGGGDFAPHRIIPDFYRAAQNGSTLKQRKPQAKRPWQHVLDLCDAYQILLERVLGGDSTHPGENWNFGPLSEDSIPVIELIQRLESFWQTLPLEIESGPPETIRLTLDSTKARTKLGWHPRLNLNQALHLTAEWYKTSLINPAHVADLTRQQIGTHQASNACHSKNNA